MSMVRLAERQPSDGQRCLVVPQWAPQAGWPVTYRAREGWKLGAWQYLNDAAMAYGEPDDEWAPLDAEADDA